MPRNDPLRNFRFRLEIDSVQQAAFSEASGFDIAVDVIEYREGNEPATPRKLSGLTKYGNVSLKWGTTDSTELYDWIQQVVDGDIDTARKDVAIVVLDEAGEDKARYEIAEAWPSKYDPMDLNAKGNDVSIESLELTNEGVRRVA